MQNILHCQVTLRLGFLPNSQITFTPSSQSLSVLTHTVTATRIVTPSDDSRFPAELFGSKALLDGSIKILLVLGLDKSSELLYGELGLLLKIWDLIQPEIQISNRYYRVDLRCWEEQEVAFNQGGQSGMQGGELIEVTSRQQMLLLLSQLAGVKRKNSSVAAELIIQQTSSLQRSCILLAEPSRALLQKQQFHQFLRELNNSDDRSPQTKGHPNVEPLLSLVRSASAGVKQPLQLICQVEQETTLSSNPLIPVIEKLSQRGSQHLLAQELTQEITKQEAILSRLRQKHKTVLGVLSKCMAVECGQLERRSQPALDAIATGPRDKFRLATLKRQQNEDLLQMIDRNLSQQELELSNIKQQHAINFQRLHKQKKLLNQNLSRILSQIHELTNPEPHADPELVTSSIYSRPKNKLKPRADEVENNNPSSSFISGHLPTHKSLKPKNEKKDILLLQTSDKDPSQQILSPETGNLTVSIRKGQTLSEIERLMRLVIKQEEVIQGCLSRRGSQLTAGLKRQLKSSCLQIRLGGLGELLKMSREEGRFQEWTRAEQGFRDWMQRRQLSQACGTVTTIREM